MALSSTPYATNSFAQQVNAGNGHFDYTKPNAPTTMSYHGGTIVAGNNIIGRINSWQPSGAYTREGVFVYELNTTTWGLPVDYIPGKATGFNITYTRSEVWGQELELALGYGAVWANLTDQTYPFAANEYLFKGNSPYRVWLYSGCWFTEKNPDSWTNEGDGVYKINCGMVFVSRVRTT